MKSFTLSGALLLAGSAVAQDPSNISDKKIQAFMADYELQEQTRSTNSPPPKLEKALTNADMGLLADYGCWCYFENNHGAGHGHPIDELDGYCKTLHDGYECIMFDSDAAGSPCIPWEVSYTSAFGTGFPSGLSIDQVQTRCDDNNGAGTCGAMACMVEGWFTQQFFSYATAGGVINEANRHANGFEPKDSCPISAGVRSDKACCGDYPLRATYKTYSGARDCCSGRTFNTDMFTCCSDGRIAIVC